MLRDGYHEQGLHGKQGRRMRDTHRSIFSTLTATHILTAIQRETTMQIAAIDIQTIACLGRDRLRHTWIELDGCG